MSYEFGLKLWSTNTDHYFDEARRLYADGVFSYVELYVIPDTLDTIEKWETLDIPVNLHCPHFFHGFNLAKREKEKINRTIHEQVKQFADALNSEYIIFHCGVDGGIEESARQLKAFTEPRAIIENKPYRPVPGINGKMCRGATIEEIKYVLDEVKCGFCLDIGHTICSANSQKLDRWKYIEEFNKLKPKVYHLTDLENLGSEYDSHAHIGNGEVDISKVLLFITNESMITIETEKNNPQELADWKKDIRCLKRMIFSFNYENKKSRTKRY
ncbi:MAG: sugar phosphate isomerase/epimerase [Holosporaceae bacterium]|jgi:endonuclease IV|nr:sugar phosphate isomerase/epimerase [Holosporaceae bacterium]